MTRNPTTANGPGPSRPDLDRSAPDRPVRRPAADAKVRRPAADAHWSAWAVPATLATAGLAIGTVDLLNPQYHPVTDVVSGYVHGRAGWLIVAAVLGIAAASAALAYRLRGLLRPRSVRVGRLLLGVWSASLVVAAVFPADPLGQWDKPPSTTAMVHGLAAFAAFLTLPAAAVLLTRGLPVEGRSRRWLAFLAGAAAFVTVAFAVTLVDVMDGPSLGIGGVPTFVGLTERLTLLANMVWLGAAASTVRA